MKYFITSLLIIIICACQSNSDKRIEFALKSAGKNRPELEKVLEHYKNDSLKLLAARFLIGNLPGNVAYDSTKLYKYRGILLRYDSLKKAHPERKSELLWQINDEWREFSKHMNIHFDIYSKLEPDLHHVTANYLIKNIDQAFDAWNKSSCKDSTNFQDFLHYTLPYRRKNGYVMEAWRDYFLKEYGEYITKFNSPRELTDSLFEQVEDYQVNWVSLSSYPYICLGDYNMGRMSRCDDRCWFNSMLLSALGLPCAIDYVPYWGNRNSSHSWNALVLDGKTYPFESTGKKGKWKSKLVYNNVWIDEYWMISRLPKVLRYSDLPIEEGPSRSKSANEENTPASFFNSKYEDVSDAYFTTSDISIPITDTEIPSGTEYAYLCVFNEDAWRPVYWGKIKSGAVSFKKMGRNIVYLPAYYMNGQLIPFNKAFLLQQDGNIRYLNPDHLNLISIQPERKYCKRPDLDFWTQWNIGASFEIANNRDFRSAQTVFTVDECKLIPNIYRLDKPVKSRYIRYVFPEHTDVLSELFFFTQNAKGELEETEGKFFSPNPDWTTEFTKLFDKDILTYTNLSSSQSAQNTKCWVGTDFGKELEIVAVGICSRNDKNNVIKGMEYELFFWNSQWISLGRQIAQDYSLQYDNVPANALLLLKCTTEGKENRIFTYEDGVQVWW